MQVRAFPADGARVYPLALDDRGNERIAVLSFDDGNQNVIIGVTAEQAEALLVGLQSALALDDPSWAGGLMLER
jgi:hypothetical protein